MAVIVLNHNKRDELLKCLRSVRETTRVACEIVVVDNGSTDGSCPAASEAYPGIHLVQCAENLGAPGGRNIGLEYVIQNIRCRYILFLDNDALVEKECLEQLVGALNKDAQAGIACPKTYQRLESKILFSTGIRVNLGTASIYDIGSGQPDRGQYDTSRYVDACGAFTFLIRRDAATQLGGFDDAFNPYGWEDVDLCLRARKRGYKILYVPTAVACHKGGKAGRGIIPKYEHLKARNFIIIMKKHARPMEWITAVIIAPLKASATILGEMARGNFKTVLPVLRGSWKGMTGR